MAILPWFRAALGHVLFKESTLLILFTWVGPAREFTKGEKKTVIRTTTIKKAEC